MSFLQLRRYGFIKILWIGWYWLWYKKIALDQYKEPRYKWQHNSAAATPYQTHAVLYSDLELLKITSAFTDHSVQLIARYLATVSKDFLPMKNTVAYVPIIREIEGNSGVKYK